MDKTVRLTTVPDGTVIDGDQIARENTDTASIAMQVPVVTKAPHPWVGDPVPRAKPIVPKVSVFKLTVSKVGDDNVVAIAKSAKIELLLDLANQFEGVDYKFMSLERIEA